ncbi:uncharacterized protein LOC144142288 isoform X2 [Haemaphysalis longicornis]
MEAANKPSHQIGQTQRQRQTLLGSLQALRKKAVNETEQCKFCKTSIDYIEKNLMNRTAAQVMFRVSEVCELFAEPIEEPCRKAVDKNANVLYMGLKYRTDPIVLCNVMTLCPHSFPPKQQPQFTHHDSQEAPYAG